MTDWREGRWVYYALNPQAVDGAGEFLAGLRSTPSGFRIAPRRCS